jgi:hypothetical protein
MQDFKQRGRPRAKKQEPEAVEPVTPPMLKNVSQQRHVMYGEIVQPGATYVPTDANKADKMGSKRIVRAVDMGYLEWV